MGFAAFAIVRQDFSAIDPDNSGEPRGYAHVQAEPALAVDTVTDIIVY
jgi:hypothetical protein